VIAVAATLEELELLGVRYTVRDYVGTKAEGGN
jgi:hypothetical protein